ncbi:DsbA family protein [Ornithinimicrobium cerasi]|uniref:DsbA family protein n=1 Tax=Ornithinimicrobium cerasi TaxID=2248773 RepID=UPI000EFE536E|nr:thioredoxin domain-containing protein [Ornithinimicrobium cerasi]
MPRPPAPQVRTVSKGPSTALIGGVVVLVVVLVAALVWAATRDPGGLDSQGTGSTLPEGGGVSLGPGTDADVTQIRIYEDFQCPWCGVLENSIGPALTEKIEAGEVNVTFQIMSFLDGSLGNDSSVRAANAALCADDADVFLDFHAAVFANQPQQEGAGFTDEQFLRWAEEAGVEGEALETFGRCVEDLPHTGYVEDMQTRANQDGVTGTPTLVVNGETVGNEEMSRLMQDPGALDEVLADHS